MLVWNHNSSLELALGFGIKDAIIEYSTDGANWTTLGTYEFAQGSGAAGYAHNTTVDLGGAVAKYIKITANSNWGGIVTQYGLSEVRFFYIPVLARELNPASGTIDSDVDNVTLSWRAGREAASHNVYLSTDEQAVIDETISPVSIPADRSYASYDTAALELGQTYYWKVNEVNEAETPTTWQGDVLNFSTQEYLVVDDIEDYNDFEPDRIFDTWIDGWGVPTNGSQVGYAEPTFVETTIVHGGDQSMPLFYDNTTAGYSEATVNVANLQVGQDWTKYGIKTLSLYFYGDPCNVIAEQMYVKVNGSKLVYDGDARAIARPWWTQWNIDIASVGVNLQNVTTLAIGVDGAGASGIVYVDDILLYRLAPEPPLEIFFEAEAADILGASWRIYDDPGASGGRYIGSEDGDGDDNSNPPGAEWVATYNFTVSGGIYKIQARIITAPGNSFWVRIPDATSPQITRDDGWVNTNPMDEGSTWHWDEFHNDEQDDNVVYFTLSAGQHTLEIAKREDGALLDSILITSEVGLD